MKLFHLETEFYALDVTTDIIVYAYDEQEARKLAAMHDDGNVALKGSWWLDENKTSCKEIELPLVSDVIFSFFTPA